MLFQGEIVHFIPKNEVLKSESVKIGNAKLFFLLYYILLIFLVNLSIYLKIIDSITLH